MKVIKSENFERCAYTHDGTQNGFGAPRDRKGQGKIMFGPTDSNSKKKIIDLWTKKKKKKKKVDPSEDALSEGML